MVKKRRISKYNVKKIMQCFCLYLTANQASKFLEFNRKTINKYFNIFRELIANQQKKELRHFVGEIEIDESYFGARRIKGVVSKRGRRTH